MSRYRRKQSDEFGRGGSQGCRSHSKNPPTRTWQQPTVPPWEKKFVRDVGCISWKRFLDNKKYTENYVDILQWNDSAAEEAFNNAKKLFWAKINNQPCDISLPDPDMYIEEVNWNAEVNKELIMDLEREQNIRDNEVQVETAPNVYNVGELLDSDVPVPCTEWGDADGVPSKGGENADTALPIGWGEYCKDVVNIEYPWQWTNYGMEANRWQNYQYNSWYWNYGKNSMPEAGPSWYTLGYVIYNEYPWHWTNYNVEANRWQNNHNNSRNWNHEGRLNYDRNSIPEEGPSWYTPGYRTTGFHSKDYQVNHGSRNARGRGRHDASGQISHRRGNYTR